MPYPRSDSSDEDFEESIRQLGQEIRQDVHRMSRHGLIRDDPRPLSREIEVANPRTGHYRHRRNSDSMEIPQYDSNRTEPPFGSGRRTQTSILDNIDADGERPLPASRNHANSATPKYLDERISNMAGARIYRATDMAELRSQIPTAGSSAHSNYRSIYPRFGSDNSESRAVRDRFDPTNESYIYRPSSPSRHPGRRYRLPSERDLYEVGGLSGSARTQLDRDSVARRRDGWREERTQSGRR